MNTHPYILRYDAQLCGLVLAPPNNRKVAIEIGLDLGVLPDITPERDLRVQVFDAVDQVLSLDDVSEIRTCCRHAARQGPVGALVDEISESVMTVPYVRALADAYASRGLSQIAMFFLNATRHLEVLELRDDVRKVFNNEIHRLLRLSPEGASNDTLDRISRLELLREYVCNAAFRTELHDLCFKLTYNTEP